MNTSHLQTSTAKPQQGRTDDALTAPASRLDDNPSSFPGHMQMFEGLKLTHWRSAINADDVVLLTLDRADTSVNALSRAVLDELARIIERLRINQPRGVIICSGKEDSFVVGADLHEFEGYARDGVVLDAIRNGQKVFQSLAELPCPTVAAIHGTCLGGGTEMSLACDMRVASNAGATRIGLPEVQLGIHPGWGGTARLPRLIGTPDAMQLMLTGAPARAKKARSLGLVDKLVAPDELIDAARKLVRTGYKRPLRQRLTAWLTNTWPARQALAPVLVKRTARKARKAHYPAPFATIDVWRKGGGNIHRRLLLEARSVERLAATPTAANLMRVFFLSERLKGLGKGVEHAVRHIHVVGAGVMGGDIAAWCAWRGFEVSLQDREMKYISPAMDRAKALFQRKAHGDKAKAEAAGKRLQADVDGKGVATSQLAIEAIFEDKDAKQALYAALEKHLDPAALLASNTSSIPLAELRETLQRPQQFMGLHFFNPVAKMPLVEVVLHDQLDDEARKRGLALVHALGKFPVPVKGTPGFLVNRILMPYLLESIRALSEGVPGAVLDKAARHFGMPMGPIELADTVGLDVAASVGRELAPFLGLELPEGVDKLVDTGNRGKKTSKGFYVWEDGKPQKPEVPDNYTAPDDLTDRIILPMLNEAVACLAEGVVEDAGLLDAGVIFGTGFAPFRGGPIAYVRSCGVDDLTTRLEALAARYGDRFKPRPGWDNPALKEDQAA